MNYLKKIGAPYLILLTICVAIIVVAEYLFLTGDRLHGIFVGLWAPMVMGLMIFLKLVDRS